MNNKPGQTWTLDKLRFLRENAASMTCQELADVLGISYASVSIKCHDLGIKTKDATQTPRKTGQTQANKSKPKPVAKPPMRSIVKPIKTSALEPKACTTPMTWGGSVGGEKPYEFLK